MLHTATRLLHFYQKTQQKLTKGTMLNKALKWKVMRPYTKIKEVLYKLVVLIEYGPWLFTWKPVITSINGSVSKAI